MTSSSYGIPSGPDPVWTHLISWFDRDWFKRLWVLQEACLAKHTVFLCGTALVKYEDATQLARSLRQTQLVIASKGQQGVPPGIDLLHSLVDFKEILSEEYDIGLLLLLNITRSLLCREIFDRIYGIFGMLHKRIRREILVDYSKENIENPQQLFILVGKLMLEEGGPANRFAIFWFMSRQRMSGTPSWLPGYMYPIDGQALFMERAGWPKDPKSAYYNARILTSLTSSNLLHPDNIQVSGMVIDEVVDAVHLDWQWSYYGSSDEDDGAIHTENASEFLRLEATCATLGQHAVVEIPSVIYCKTLVANRDIQAPGPYNPDEILEDYEKALLTSKKQKAASMSKASVRIDLGCTDMSPASRKNGDLVALSSRPRVEE